MEERPTSRLSEWLDNLARESWQLELIISGFAIFLLVGLQEPLEGMGRSLARMNPSWRVQGILAIPIAITGAAWFILLINLCIHVVLRGLWISTIGLRSVSDDIDFESLRLSTRFHHFLQNTIGSFDRYVERLEKICSVLFAFTFLILFMLVAIGGVAATGVLINLALLDWLELEGHLSTKIINLIFALSALLYFIDFVTLSRLKRVRWLTFLYYPIYRFFSLITLARLYRPLYYNLIDNRFGRGVGFLLVPYIIFLMIASSLNLVTDAYFPSSPPAQLTLNAVDYDDLMPADAISNTPSLSSRFYDNGFVELFIPYKPEDNDEALQASCPGLKEARRKGLTLEGAITIQENQKGVNPDSILLCLSALHQVFVNDSLLATPSFRFYHHAQRQQNGLFTVLDIQYLPRGEHLIRVESRQVEEDTLVCRRPAYLPFWKE